MGDIKNTTGEQTADKEIKSATKKTKERSALGAGNDAILKFINESAPYECDAIRITLKAIADGKKLAELPFDDITILNRFLMERLPKGNYTADQVRDHRIEVASEFTDKLCKFLTKKEEVGGVSKLLMQFAGNSAMVNRAVDFLKPKANEAQASQQPSNH